jgi:hypothetical protein
LSKPLKGIGPATASLLLAVHDPSNVIFFSDELYRWLLHDGKKVSPKYTAKEFEELFSKAKSFMSRVKCTPIELEKVAFVIIRESDTAPKEKKAPSGLPRGRPKKPESEKKVKVPSGRGRGRPPKASTGEPKAEKGEPKKRGRKPKVEEAEAKAEDEVNGEEKEEATATPASKKRKASATPASSANRSAKKAKA